MVKFAKSVTAVIIIGFCLIINGDDASAKLVKEYLGKYYISTYHVSDNTPAGSRQTSSGVTATEWWTAAVDYQNPLVPMYTKIYIKGLGDFQIHDYGNFGMYNGGLRALDIFVPEGYEGLYYADVYVYREETPEEKEARLQRKEERKAKERAEIQQNEFILVHDATLAPWQIRTHKDAIQGGVVRLNTDSFVDYAWLDVIDTEKGDDRIIYVGDMSLVLLHPVVTLAEVIEDAVG